jgi:hypothetical protein
VGQQHGLVGGNGWRHGAQMAAPAIAHGGRASAQFAHRAYYDAGPAETSIA